MMVGTGLMIALTSPTARDAVGASPGRLSSGFYVFTEGLTIATPLVMLSFVLLAAAGVRHVRHHDAGRPTAPWRIALCGGALLA
jgi:hypothetical protein